MKLVATHTHTHTYGLHFNQTPHVWPPPAPPERLTGHKIRGSQTDDFNPDLEAVLYFWIAVYDVSPDDELNVNC